jgi:hypothetical protein
MPQVDKATFFPVVFWTFILYIGGFLFLNSSSLFTLLSGLKLAGKRAARKYASALIGRRLLSSLLLFPWISL